MARFTLQVGYWNVRGVRSRLTEVEKLATVLDVFGLAEVRIANERDFELLGFDIRFGGPGTWGSSVHQAFCTSSLVSCRTIRWLVWGCGAGLG